MPERSSGEEVSIGDWLIGDWSPCEPIARTTNVKTAPYPGLYLKLPLFGLVGNHMHCFQFQDKRGALPMKKSSLIFLILTFVLALVSGAIAQETREVNKSGSFEPNGRLYVDTYKGSIDILPWDKSEIQIHAVIEADGSDRYSREQVEDTEVRIDLSSTSAHVKTDYDRAKRRHHGFLGLFDGSSYALPFVHYTIKVPRTTRVVIKDYKSKTTIDDLQADVELDTYKGEVGIGRLSGALDLKTYKGEVKVEFADLKGRSRVETYKGEIEMSLPKEKGFDLDANIGRHAQLISDFERVRDREYSRHRGYDMRTSVNGGGPLLRIKTDHGSVRLTGR